MPNDTRIQASVDCLSTGMVLWYSHFMSRLEPSRPKTDVAQENRNDVLPTLEEERLLEAGVLYPKHRAVSRHELFDEISKHHHLDLQRIEKPSS
jgi:hypothetical protein